MADWQNKLYFGDNLHILREYVPDQSVDLIYLDPPFNSQATYNVLFADKSGQRSPAQIKAFDDTWHWSPESQATYEELITSDNKALANLIQSMHSFLSTCDMMAYLVMMAPRLVEMHRVLKLTGSLYLHCDPTASHYLKLLLDAVFGAENFKREIIWERSKPHGNVTKNYGAIHDVVLFYSRSGDYAWNKPHKPYFLPSGELDPNIAEQVLKQYANVEEGTGRRFQPTSLLNPNPDRPNLTYEFHGHEKVWRWTRERMEKAERENRLYFPKEGKGIPREKRYLDEQEGFPLQDMWYDIPAPSFTERLGYPTQKPEALLERIIQASSNEGDVVLDPFCGCGTTVAVAERLKRRWLGIDITPLAINLMRHRLTTAFGSDLAPYEVVGQPVDIDGARALAEQDRHHFELWALGLVDAAPWQAKRGADRGVDGFINFLDDDSGKAKTILVQIKSGHISSGQVRDLKGAMDREKAVMAALITLTPFTGPMSVEAATAGVYSPPHLPNKHYPRVQLLNVAELLAGTARLEYPRHWGGATTIKAAPKAKKQSPTHPEHPFDEGYQP